MALNFTVEYSALEIKFIETVLCLQGHTKDFFYIMVDRKKSFTLILLYVSIFTIF